MKQSPPKVGGGLTSAKYRFGGTNKRASLRRSTNCNAQVRLDGWLMEPPHEDFTPAQFQQPLLCWESRGKCKNEIGLTREDLEAKVIKLPG